MRDNSSSNKNISRSEIKVSPAYRKGDSEKIKTTIVLSAPGQEEEKASRPAAGQTGTTLQMAIDILHLKDSSIFPSKNLDDYTIVNAVEKIHYKKKTGRTEGTNLEILEQENLERISNVLSNSENVLALGDKAQLAVESSNFSGNILKAKHPSMQALNKKYKSDKDSPPERYKERVKKWTNEIT